MMTDEIKQPEESEFPQTRNISSHSRERDGERVRKAPGGVSGKSCSAVGCEALSVLEQLSDRAALKHFVRFLFTLGDCRQTSAVSDSESTLMRGWCGPGAGLVRVLGDVTSGKQFVCF